MRRTEQYKTITVNGAQLSVGCYGTIKNMNGDKLKKCLNKRTGYVTVGIKNPATQKYRNEYVHRLVGMAWVPCAGDFADYQIDHIRPSRHSNSYRNLRWVSRQDNNSRLHARRLKSKNHHHSTHHGYAIKATQNGTTLYFKNGCSASRGIGCSTTLIYKALNPAEYTKSAYGWILSYVPVAQVKGAIR